MRRRGRTQQRQQQNRTRRSLCCGLLAWHARTCMRAHASQASYAVCHQPCKRRCLAKTWTTCRSRRCSCGRRCGSTIVRSSSSRAGVPPQQRHLAAHARLTPCAAAPAVMRPRCCRWAPSSSARPSTLPSCRCDTAARPASRRSASCMMSSGAAGGMSACTLAALRHQGAEMQCPHGTLTAAATAYAQACTAPAPASRECCPCCAASPAANE